jgi:hypothetical protein
MELGFLSPLFDRPGPWASVYFDTMTASEDAAARQKLGARSAGEQLLEQGADEETSRVVYETLAALPRGAEPPGQAVFASAGEVVLSVPLTSQPPGGGPHTSWQPLPHISPLIELAESDPWCLVAYIDRTGADFELRGPYGSSEAGEAEGADWPVHRTATGDPSESHFQAAVENTWEQNAALIADELRERHKASGAEVVVLSGDARERQAVYDKLPSDLREHAVQAEHGVRADSRQRGSSTNTAGGRRLLDEEIAWARAEYTRQRTAQVLERFQAGRVPGEDGTLDATEGVPALVEAAREHRVSALLLRPGGPDLHREVWIGEEPDQVAVRRTESAALGARNPAPARADDALLRSAAVTGADVLTVQPELVAGGAPENLPDGGLGALLRWPYEGAPEGGGAGGGQHATGQ